MEGRQQLLGLDPVHVCVCFQIYFNSPVFLWAGEYSRDIVEKGKGLRALSYGQSVCLCL